MSGASEHPLDAELRDYLSHSDLRLMAEGKHAEFLQRARLRVRRSHYLTGLSVVPWAVLIVGVLSLYSRVPSALLAVIVVLAVLLATMFAVKLWLWSRRWRALFDGDSAALARLAEDHALLADRRVERPDRVHARVQGHDLQRLQGFDLDGAQCLQVPRVHGFQVRALPSQSISQTESSCPKPCLGLWPRRQPKAQGSCFQR